jgi:hypothetical protein
VVKIKQITSGRWIVLLWAPWAREGAGGWLVLHGPVETKEAALIAASGERDLRAVPQLLPYRILAEADQLKELCAAALYFGGFAPLTDWQKLAIKTIAEMRRHARRMIEGRGEPQKTTIVSKEKENHHCFEREGKPMTSPNPPSIPPQAIQLAQSAADRIRAVYGMSDVHVFLRAGKTSFVVKSAGPLASAPPTR